MGKIIYLNERRAIPAMALQRLAALRRQTTLCERRAQTAGDQQVSDLPHCTAALQQLLRYALNVEREVDSVLVDGGDVARRKLLDMASRQSFWITNFGSYVILHFLPDEYYTLYLDPEDPLVTSELFEPVVLAAVDRENRLNRQSEGGKVIKLF